MTPERRVTALHERMETRRRVRERRKTGALGAAGAVLSLCLILLIYDGSGAHLGGAVGMYSGATMLFGNAGVYVLVALAAFMAGVVVTIILRNRRDGPRAEKQEKESEHEKGRENHEA